MVVWRTANLGQASLLGVTLGLGAATKLSPLPLAVAFGGAGFAIFAIGQAFPSVIDRPMRMASVR